MRRTTHKGVFLIVEGSSDAKFYGQIIDKEQCQILPPAEGRDIAIEALRILQQDSASDVVAIVDKDFDELNGLLPDIPNLFFTDTHDLETMLLRSPALEKLIVEFGSEEKLEKFSKDVREALLVAGCTIGYLRWISLKDSLHLKFEGISFSDFIDKDLKINELLLIKEVKNKSLRPNLDVNDLQQRLKQQKDASHDRWQLCCGHDFMSILSIGLRKAIGSQNPNVVTVEILERSLRLAYEQVYFHATELYVTIGNWEKDHPPYRILKLI